MFKEPLPLFAQEFAELAAERTVTSRNQPRNPPLRPMCIGDFETEQIYNGNFLELARRIPDGSIDLIIADPPYNASKGNVWTLESRALPGSGGAWKKIDQVWDDMTLDEYLAFTLSWLSEARRILKQTGSMWVHGTYHSAGITNVAMQMLGIEIINEVVWYKRNSFPSNSEPRNDLVGSSRREARVSVQLRSLKVRRLF